jgi:hypothetical protein
MAPRTVAESRWVESELAQRLSAANPLPVGLPHGPVRSYVRLRVWRQGQPFAAFDPERVSPPSGSTTGSGRSTLSLSPQFEPGVVRLDPVRSTIRPFDDDLA